MTKSKKTRSRTGKTVTKRKRASQRRDAGRQARPAVERALALLEASAATGRPAALNELAASVDIPLATAFRLCQRLEETDYLVRDGNARRYTIGPRLMRLGLAIVRAGGPLNARRQIMAELVEAIGETCNLTTLVGDEVLYLDRVETRWPLRLALEPGSRVPIHCTASGKLFLATMMARQRERLLSALPLTACAPNTIVDVRKLRAALAQITARGYSTDNEEFLSGLVAVAVPVRNPKRQVVAAVAVHAPIARLDLPALIREVPRLEAAATRIAATFE